MNAADGTGGRTIPFEFTGRGTEYFGIWIVNILLSIVTLGIYSAWAKVRNKQYFYGNTLLEGSPFEYHGKPIAILKGRIIAIVAIAIYSGLSQISPVLQIGILLIFAVLFPWLLVRSLRFNAYNSSYRNLRFKFDGTYWGALKVMVLPPVIVMAVLVGIIALMVSRGRGSDIGTVISMAIVMPLLFMLIVAALLPFWEYIRRRFIVNHYGYGQENFVFDGTAGDFYKIYLIAFAVFIVGGILITILGVMLAAPYMKGIFQLPSSAVPSAGMVIAGAVAYIVFILIYALIFAYIQTAIANLVFNKTSLAGHEFESNLRTGGMLWIYVSNLILIVITVGLFIPWAKVRTMKYRFDHLSLLPVGTLDSFVANQQSQVSATGEELADMLDFDIAL